MGKKALAFILLTFSATNNLWAQGCSDAGDCTIHSIKINTIQDPGLTGSKNEFRISTGYARGERETNIYTLQLEYARRLEAGFSFSGKLNYNSINGELAKINGPGDIFLSVEKRFAEKAKWEKNVFAGLKIPLGNADERSNGLGLPMVYQPTLGTTDLLAGISFTRKQWGISLAYQQPLNNLNNNSFLVSQYPAQHAANNYPSANRFSRKADLVTRIAKSFTSGKHLQIQPGILGIYHTGLDSYRDATNRELHIEGSDGLTLNAIINLQYETGKNNSLMLSAGTPLFVRDERPDGLTRKFVLSLEYAFRF